MRDHSLRAYTPPHFIVELKKAVCLIQNWVASPLPSNAVLFPVLAPSLRLFQTLLIYRRKFLSIFSGAGFKAVTRTVRSSPTSECSLLSHKPFRIRSCCKRDRVGNSKVGQLNDTPIENTMKSKFLGKNLIEKLA